MSFTQYSNSHFESISFAISFGGFISFQLKEDVVLMCTLTKGRIWQTVFSFNSVSANAPVIVNPRTPGRDSGSFAGNFPLFDERKGQISGTLTSFPGHPRTAGEWTGVFSTEVDWVKNRLSGKMAFFKGTLSRCSARANLTGFFHRKTMALSLCRVMPTRQSDR